MPETACQVKIPIFEGPLDLLLHLIRKNEVDIYDIPIAAITSQYLAYLELMEALNIEVAGEFLVMAATLLQIKSRMLLPALAVDEEAEDPRLEIARPLLEYIRYREAARWLDQRTWLGRDVFERGFSDDVAPPQEERSLFNLGLFDLIDAFKELMDRRVAGGVLAVGLEQASLSDKIGQLIELFRGQTDLLFADVFDAAVGRAELVLTFLAVLELARMGFIFVYQETTFGPIRLSIRPEAFEIEAYDVIEEVE